MNGKISVPIIVAIIALIEGIAAATIGAVWGKNNVSITVQINGEEITMNDSDVQRMATENEELKAKIIEYEAKIAELQSEKEEEIGVINTDYEKRISLLESEKAELSSKLEEVNGELKNVPVFEFFDCGLVINGEEKTISKDKSYVAINGRQYFSKDFIDNLLPENELATMKDGILHIGKIIKEKTKLLDQPMISNNDGEVKENMTDTYGNMYTDALCFSYRGGNTTFNAERNYSRFKCIIAMKQGENNSGYIQIETDDGNIVYTSPEITSLTEPIVVDVPINYTSKLTIRCIDKGTSYKYIFIANAILYNQE